MPINTELASKIWYRYQWCRDNGHAEFVRKADVCDAYFRGDQWSETDLSSLKEAGRPALTINKIISTIGNVMGEQIYNRNEISFRPMNGAPPETAETLRKVFKQISANNQLDWKRSDMFADGIITSRGFLDARMDFTDNMRGEVRISHLNPKNVIIDPDGEEMDPDTWNEVITTKWMTADDIAVLYSKADAELLRNRGMSFFPYGYDAIEQHRDRYGYIASTSSGIATTSGFDMSSVLRNIRIIERQHRQLDRQKQFINTTTGDTRPIPDSWDRNRIAYISQQFGLAVVSKLVKRIRWSVIADNVVLHDDWSPYKHFTVIPYFPHFRRGKTVGLVENLVGPQELLNKVSSQELHVVNTTANSGWKIKTGSLVNMSLEELEQKGSQSGLVLELTELDGAEKITPNGTPQGLDRISYKAEEHIKTISGVSDSQQGMDREDVAAKAIQTKRQAASTNMAKPMDSLIRTDYLLARNVLDLVQEFYSEERIISITHENGAGENEQMTVNQVDPEGQIVNDLTLGEYGVVISSVPQRETLEDSQFDQAVALRELGIGIPDDVLIDNSRLMNKKDIIKQMQAASQSPEAQAQAQLQQALQQAEVDKTNAEVQQKSADATLKQAKAQKEGIVAQKESMTPPESAEGQMQAEFMKVQAEIALDREKFEHEKQLDAEKMAMEREKMDMEMQMKRKEAADKAVQDRMAQAAKNQASQAVKPTQGA